MNKFILNLVFIFLFLLIPNSLVFGGSDCSSIFAELFNNFTKKSLKLSKKDTRHLLSLPSSYSRFSFFTKLTHKSSNLFHGNFYASNSLSPYPVLPIEGVFIKNVSLSPVYYITKLPTKSSSHLELLKRFRKSPALVQEMKSFIKEIILSLCIPQIKNQITFTQKEIFSLVMGSLFVLPRVSEYSSLYTLFNYYPELKDTFVEIITGIAYKQVTNIYIKPILGINVGDSLKIPQDSLPKKEDAILAFLYQDKYIPVTNNEFFFSKLRPGFISLDIKHLLNCELSSSSDQSDLSSTVNKKQKSLLNTLYMFHTTSISDPIILDFLYPISKSVITINNFLKSSSDSISRCSAVIVSHNTVLSAAHCLEDSLFVFFKPPNKNVVHAKEVYIHPDYTPSSVLDKHDFAMIRFPDGTFDGFDFVPINTNLPDNHEDLIIVGTEGKFDIKKINLEKKIIPSLDFIKENSDYSPDIIVTSSNNKSSPLAEGDSGGAVFNKNNELVAIHFASVPEDFDFNYDFHASMKANLSFIRRVIETHPDTDFGLNLIK